MNNIIISQYQYIKYSYYFYGAGSFTDCNIKNWKVMLENNDINKPMEQFDKVTMNPLAI